MEDFSKPVGFSEDNGYIKALTWFRNMESYVNTQRVKTVKNYYEPLRTAKVFSHTIISCQYRRKKLNLTKN